MADYLIARLNVPTPGVTAWSNVAWEIIAEVTDYPATEEGQNQALEAAVADAGVYAALRIDNAAQVLDPNPVRRRLDAEELEERLSTPDLPPRPGRASPEPAPEPEPLPPEE